MNHRLGLVGCCSNRIFNIDWRDLPVLTLAVALAHLHLTFVLFSVGKVHHGPLRRHRIVDKGTIICASVLKDHLSEPLEAILIEFSNVEHTVGRITEPVGAATEHFIVLEIPVVDVR